MRFEEAGRVLKRYVSAVSGCKACEKRVSSKEGKTPLSRNSGGNAEGGNRGGEEGGMGEGGEGLSARRLGIARARLGKNSNPKP